MIAFKCCVVLCPTGGRGLPRPLAAPVRGGLEDRLEDIPNAVGPAVPEVPPEALGEIAFAAGHKGQDVGVDEPVHQSQFIEGGASHAFRRAPPEKPHKLNGQAGVGGEVTQLEVLVGDRPDVEGLFKGDLVPDALAPQVLFRADALEVVAGRDDAEANLLLGEAQPPGPQLFFF